MATKKKKIFFLLGQVMSQGRGLNKKEWVCGQRREGTGASLVPWEQHQPSDKN